jgi:hypothetical protein
MYGSDPFAYDFGTELAGARERARTAQRQRDEAQAASEGTYLDLFLENRFHPAYHGGVTYGLGYPTKWEGPGPERGTSRTHRRKRSMGALPPSRRVASRRSNVSPARSTSGVV